MLGQTLRNYVSKVWREKEPLLFPLVVWSVRIVVVAEPAQQATAFMGTDSSPNADRQKQFLKSADQDVETLTPWSVEK